jgi:uncharacterized membrane-anchored protein YhcB (DUF1043 family)
MLYAIIVGLILGLVVVVFVTNNMQRQRRKEEEERRRELSKARAIIDETEDLVSNMAEIPFSLEAYNILYNRILQSLHNMLSLTDGNKDIKNRIEQINGLMTAGDFPAKDSSSVEIPNNEKQLIAMIQGIKKYRMILRSEHSKKRISSELFVAEDKKVERFQVKINVESQLRRGKMALDKNMSGSARQYFEKALNVLKQQKTTDEYVTTRMQEIEQHLSEIASDLKTANAETVKKKKEEESDGLDELFAPKKKW